MATVNKRSCGKCQAILRKDTRSQSQSFTRRADAVNWARGMELKAERENLRDPRMMASERISLGDVLVRYRDPVTSLKRCVDNEGFEIRGFEVPSTFPKADNGGLRGTSYSEVAADEAYYSGA